MTAGFTHQEWSEWVSEEEALVSLTSCLWSCVLSLCFTLLDRRESLSPAYTQGRRFVITPYKEENQRTVDIFQSHHRRFKYKEMRKRGKIGQCLDYLIQHLITIMENPSYFPLLFCHACCLFYHMCYLGFVPRWAPNIAANDCTNTGYHVQPQQYPARLWVMSSCDKPSLATISGFLSWLSLSELHYIVKTKPIPSKWRGNAMNDFHRSKCIPELESRHLSRGGHSNRLVFPLLERQRNGYWVDNNQVANCVDPCSPSMMVCNDHALCTR